MTNATTCDLKPTLQEIIHDYGALSDILMVYDELATLFACADDLDPQRTAKLLDSVNHCFQQQLDKLIDVEKQGE